MLPLGGSGIVEKIPPFVRYCILVGFIIVDPIIVDNSVSFKFVIIGVVFMLNPIYNVNPPEVPFTPGDPVYPVTPV